jgi:hypothetical protein
MRLPRAASTSGVGGMANDGSSVQLHGGKGLNAELV